MQTADRATDHEGADQIAAARLEHAREAERRKAVAKYEQGGMVERPAGHDPVDPPRAFGKRDAPGDRIVAEAIERRELAEIDFPGRDPYDARDFVVGAAEGGDDRSGRGKDLRKQAELIGHERKRLLEPVCRSSIYMERGTEFQDEIDLGEEELAGHV